MRNNKLWEGKNPTGVKLLGLSLHVCSFTVDIAKQFSEAVCQLLCSIFCQHWFFFLFNYLVYEQWYYCTVVLFCLSSGNFSFRGWELDNDSKDHLGKTKRVISLVRRLVRKKVMKCVLILCIHSFIYFWLHWVSVALPELSPVEARGDSSLLRPSGVSLQRLPLLRSLGPRRLDLSRCGTGAHQLWLQVSEALVQQLWRVAQCFRGTWDLPRSGVEPCIGSGFCATGESSSAMSFLLHIHLSDVY